MLWQVRAMLEDRPGALAALAVSCGDQLVNILGLQIFPMSDGRVVDELVLHTPAGWDAIDVEQLFVLAGVEDAVVSECSPHALEDEPVRYVRAAQQVMDHPQLLEEQLGRLLGASTQDGMPGLDMLTLDDEHGPPVRLSRGVPFTDTEQARAAELRRFAAAVLGADPGSLPTAREPVPAVDPDQVTLRPGGPQDVAALIAMHARCSAETVYRRYHVPVPHLSRRLARTMLAPPGGFSLVLAVGEEILAVGMLAPGEHGAELGLVVEDRWQRHGYGAKILRALAVEAAYQGFDTLTCMVQQDNDAVLATIGSAGLRARVSFVDGLTEYQILVRRLRGTTPLVRLLHERPELRAVHPAADLIDQSVRGGA